LEIDGEDIEESDIILLRLLNDVDGEYVGTMQYDLNNDMN
jgi:hypothetical protein